MPADHLNVGIVGLEPGRSWAAVAHVPALMALDSTFKIAGVANTSLDSGKRAAEAMNLPRAYANVAEMVAAPDIDIIAVTVRVPHHFAVVKAAIEAGKHVFCEWPLGNGLNEAMQLAALARDNNVLGVIGTQARVAPEVQYVKQLVADGVIGTVLSSTVVARANNWGGTIPDKRTYAYLLDNAQGATMLTIPVGHTLAAIREVLGDIDELSSFLTTRQTTTIVEDTGEKIATDAPDQVLINGLFKSGAPLSLHYRGGIERGDRGLVWEINGTEGDIRISGAFGHTQLVPLSIELGRGSDNALMPLEVPQQFRGDFMENVVPGNVARIYALMAQDLREGTRIAPTFDDAIDLHRQIVAIEKSAVLGKRVHLTEN